MIRVLVAAESPLVRAGLESLVTAATGLSVAGAALDMGDAARKIEDLQPDVMLLQGDFDLADLPHGTAVVALSGEPASAWATDALRSGVRAVLPEDASPAEIAAAIQAAAAGLVVLHPDTVESLIPAARTPAAPGAQTLTPREREVLEMLAEALGNKTIAWRLGVSEHTVKFHIASIFGKLNATSRTEAVMLGIRQGLILI